MGGFWGDAWTSFKAVYGPILAVAALVLALLGPIYVPDAHIQLRVVWLTSGAIILVMVALIVTNMLYAARRLAKIRLPKVIHVDVAVAATLGGTEETTLLLEQSELFGLNQPVAISCAEQLGTGQVFERQIGTGYVLNIQMNSLIQVRVSREVSNQRELWQRIKSRELPILTQIVIRPSNAINEVDVGEAVA